MRRYGPGLRVFGVQFSVRTLLIVLGLMSGAESIEKELLQSFRCFNWGILGANLE
jgi:hypothetical protein